jgi:hypothetical protein
MNKMKKIPIFIILLSAFLASNAQMNPQARCASDAGTLPLNYNTSKTTALTENFETFVPPSSLDGWAINRFNVSFTWDTASFLPVTGLRYMHCLYDTNLMQQDEWLITPLLDLSPCTAVSIRFYWNGSKYWSVYPYDSCDLNLKCSTDGGNTWSAPLWSEETDTANFVSWTWYQVTVPVPAAAGCANVKFAFQYYGLDGAEFSVDDVLIDTVGGIFVGMHDHYPAKENVKVYPNPAKDMICVEPASALQSEIIYNVLGEAVMIIGKDNISSKIDIFRLSEGIYYLEMISENDKIVRKFVITR